MTTEHQSPLAAAFSGLAHSADGILHALEHSVKWVQKTKAPGVVTAAEVTVHLYKMIASVRKGRWEDFGDHSLAVSSALLNSTTMGIPGLAEGLNDATVAVRRAGGDKNAGITIEEAEQAGLHAIQTEIGDRLFAWAYPDAVPQIRVGDGEAEPKPQGFRPMEKLNPETIDLIRSTLREANAPQLTFERDVITLPTKGPDKSTGSRNRENQGSGPPVVFSLEVRTFQPRPATGENPGADRPFDVENGVASAVQAKVTICPVTATAGKVVIQTSGTPGRLTPGLSTPAAAAPASTIEVQTGKDGSSYTLGISAPTGAPGDGVRANLTIASAPGSITISGTFGCNASPAHEMVLRDTSGRGVFLAGHMPTKEGHAFHPGSKGTDRPTNVIRMTLGLDASGKFDGRMTAEVKGAQGHVIGRSEGARDLPGKDQIAAWNHMVMKNLTPPQMAEPRPAPERPQPAMGKNMGRSPQGPER